MVRDPLEGIKKEWLPLQIIHFSLIAGILIFLATVLLLSPEGQCSLSDREPLCGASTAYCRAYS